MHRRATAAAKRRTTAPTAGNNATTLMMWDGQADYVQIWSEDVGGGGSPATISSISRWHNQRGARGWIVAGGALYSLSGTPYFFYDGTNTHNAADQFDNWRTYERHYAPAATGDTYLSDRFHEAPYNHQTLGVLGMTNYRNQAEYFPGSPDGTPFWPWHDDERWGTTGAAAAVAAGEGTAAWTTALNSALSPVATFGGARTLCADFTMFCQTCVFFGHTGIAYDAEGYGYANKDSSMWSANSYPSMPGGQSETTTRRYVKLRGQQMALIQATQMPNSDTYFYHQRITGSWQELYQYVVGNTGSLTAFDGAAYDSFIAGLGSISGISKLILGESEFYKNPVISSWDNAYKFDHMGILARMSRLFTDSERLAAMRRLGLCGMLWPTSGSSGSELGNAMNVSDFTVALTAAVKWGMFRKTIVWALTMSDAVQGGGNQTQDHGVYEPSFQAALVDAVADATAPVCTVTTPASSSSGAGATVTVAGNVTDNMAVWRVEWSNSLTGGTGSFQLTFNNTTAGWNPNNGSQAPQNASIPITFNVGFSGDVALAVGFNVITVTAYDTHGNSHAVVLTRTRT